MNQNFEKLKEIYENIYNLTLQMGILIEQGVSEEFGGVLDKRGEFITEADSILAETKFSDEEKAHINSIVKKIRIMEERNMAQMQMRSDEIKKQISQVGMGSRAISAYKASKEVDSIVVDDREV